MVSTRRHVTSVEGLGVEGLGVEGLGVEGLGSEAIAPVVSEKMALSHPRQPLRPDLPTMYDLPSEDPEEPGLPDEFHDLQPQLLSRTLSLTQYRPEDCFTVSDLNVYYDENHTGWYKRPDWFLTVGVSRMYNDEDARRSYVVWQEGKSPDVVVEILSEGTEAEDLGRFYEAISEASGEGASASTSEISETDQNTETLENLAVADLAVLKTSRERPPEKFEVYETYLQVPHYLVYDRRTQVLRYFQWIEGAYQERSLNPTPPMVWLADLDIGLGIWRGKFEGIPGNWLRWCDRQGNWLLTDTEQANQQLAQERQAREQAEAKLLQTARNLLATGMAADQVAEIVGLSTDQIAEVLEGQD